MVSKSNNGVNENSFISFQEALVYLENNWLIYKLNPLYLRLKGCVDNVRDDNKMIYKDESVKNPKGFYVDGFLKLSAKELEQLWFNDKYGGELYIEGMKFVVGKINGKHFECDDGSISILDPIYVSLHGVFVKKEDLEEIHSTYGVPYGSGHSKQTEKAGVEKAETLNVRSETTYLHIIAALLGYIKGEVPSVDMHPSHTTEGAMINSLVDHYSGYSGLSKRTLEHKFAQAKKKLEE